MDLEGHMSFRISMSFIRPGPHRLSDKVDRINVHAESDARV